jgi:hypothetical protein
VKRRLTLTLHAYLIRPTSRLNWISRAEKMYMSYRISFMSCVGFMIVAASHLGTKKKIRSDDGADHISRRSKFPFAFMMKAVLSAAVSHPLTSLRRVVWVALHPSRPSSLRGRYGPGGAPFQSLPSVAA